MAKDTKPLSELELDETTEAQINRPRREVLEWADTWELNRAFRSGDHEVKQLKTKVLPKLDEKMSDEEYAVYMDQAILLSAAAETADSWEGMIFKVAPRYRVNGNELTEQFMSAFSNVTDTGMDADELAREIVDEVIITNRMGALIDFPMIEVGDEDKSRGQQIQDGDFSNCLIYKAESIINWHYETIKGNKQLSLVVLKERVDSFNMDQFGMDQLFQYRVLTLEPTNDTEFGYVYRQRLFVEIPSEGEKSEFRLVMDLFPTMDMGRGPEMIEKIPFWIFNRSGQESAGDIKAPILDGITQLNKGHFRNSADYENEIHKVSIKTPVIPGGVMENTDLVMGKVIETQYPDSRPFILESGNTSPLAEEMAAKEERMAHMGAKVLGQSNAQITAETARIQAASEESVLGDIAQIIASDYADMLMFKLIWDFGQDIRNVTVEFNTDFFDNEITITDLISAFGWVQAGGGSFDAYFELLKKRNAYPKGWTKEQELDAIKETQTMLKNLGITGMEGTEEIGATNVILDDQGNPVTIME